ncbi:MAG: extracellular solute-binding protein [Anaerolineae bacterium]|jgi:putative aldouronate transport system substrate-binding protein|nr:extracellular solute-binding protein [Anaerolineae bacterium]
MKKSKIVQWLIVLIVVAFFINACAKSEEEPAVPNEDTTVEESTETQVDLPEGEWRNTPPYAAYDEEFTVVMVKGGQDAASFLPEGETIEDNQILTYIETMLNINIDFSWIVPSDSYVEKLNLAIASGETPDVMIVDAQQLEQLIEADAIEDMTPYIDEFANADILENYAQTNGCAIESATYDGKIMAIPNVVPQADAPIMAWVRQDWLDALGLPAPETVDDIEMIARAFIEQDPDGNGEADTYGLTGTMQPVAVPSNLHGFDAIFNAYGAFPTLFYRNSAGEVVYGSVQPEVKEALIRLKQMYDDGLIDPEFATSTTDTANQIVVGGKGGIMMGPWWISWWPLNDSVANDPNANWQPFLIKGMNGEYTFSMAPCTNGYVVVKKGFEHPEVALKILNIQNDLSYGFNDAPQYYENFNEIWTLLFPVPFLIEQPYVVERMGREYQAAVEGTLSPDTFGDAMQLEFTQIQNDIANPRAVPADWATRMARLDAALLLAGGFNEVREDPAASRIYPTDPRWASLKKMEEEMFLQVITGAQPIEYFDTFVTDWYNNGGQDLLDQMN